MCSRFSKNQYKLELECYHESRYIYVMYISLKKQYAILFLQIFIQYQSHSFMVRFFLKRIYPQGEAGGLPFHPHVLHSLTSLSNNDIFHAVFLPMSVIPSAAPQYPFDFICKCNSVTPPTVCHLESPTDKSLHSMYVFISPSQLAVGSLKNKSCHFYMAASFESH